MDGAIPAIPLPGIPPGARAGELSAQSTLIGEAVPHFAQAFPRRPVTRTA